MEAADVVKTLKGALAYAKFKDADIATATYKFLAELDADLVECDYELSGAVIAAIDATNDAINNSDADKEALNKKLSNLEAVARDYEEEDEDEEEED